MVTNFYLNEYMIKNYQQGILIIVFIWVNMTISVYRHRQMSFSLQTRPGQMLARGLDPARRSILSGPQSILYIIIKSNKWTIKT